MTDQGFSKPEKSIPVFEKEKQAQIEARKKEYAQLIKPLPEKAIKPHESKSFLSTVNPQYIIERLNEVFGWNGWSHQCIEEVVNERGVLYKGVLTLVVANHKIESYGFSPWKKTKSGIPEDGDTYKGAKTDSLSKAASYLGIANDVFKGIQTHKQNEFEYRTEHQDPGEFIMPFGSETKGKPLKNIPKKDIVSAVNWMMGTKEKAEKFKELIKVCNEYLQDQKA